MTVRCGWLPAWKLPGSRTMMAEWQPLKPTHWANQLPWAVGWPLGELTAGLDGQQTTAYILILWDKYWLFWLKFVKKWSILTGQYFDKKTLHWENKKGRGLSPPSPCTVVLIEKYLHSEIQDNFLLFKKTATVDFIFSCLTNPQWYPMKHLIFIF